MNSPNTDKQIHTLHNMSHCCLSPKVVAAPKLSSTSPSNDTIVVGWEPVDHVLLYTISIIMEGSDSRVKLNTTDTSVTFSGLEAGTTYCIKGNAWDPEKRQGDDFTVCQITRKEERGIFG